MDNAKKTNRTSPDMHADLLRILRENYPPLFNNEGQIYPDELQNILQNFETNMAEKFEFRWVGKQQAKKNAYTPSKAALAPDKHRSANFDQTENLIIEGENLESMKLLLSGYQRNVKCIYIDPPYNTGKDFIYTDNFTEGKKAYWEQSGTTKDGVKLDTNSESAGRYHSNWLSMIYPRMVLAWKLLRDDGVIFVSIDDNEVHNLRKLMDEVFGEENFVCQFVWRTDGNFDNQAKIKICHEYVICYAKDSLKFSTMNVIDPNISEDSKLFKDEIRNTIVKNGPKNPVSKILLPAGFPTDFESGEIESDRNTWPHYNTNVHVKDFKTEHNCIVESGWSSKNLLLSFIESAYEPVVDIYGQSTKFFITKTGSIEVTKSRSNDKSHILSILSNMGNTQSTSNSLKEIGIEFAYPKPIKLLKYLINIASNNSDLVLDFFAGSGTTAHAVMQLNAEDGGNRKFILVQIPETTDQQSEAYKAGYQKISDITIERVKRAAKKIKQEHPDTKADFGFKVFTLTQSSFPENHFEYNPDQSDEENEKELKKYIAKLEQNLFFEFDHEKLLYEIMTKEGFTLNAKTDREHNFMDNSVLRLSDEYQQALICFDQNLHDNTVDTVLKTEEYRKMIFIVLGRAVNSTQKWHLNQALGENLRII